MKHGIKVLMVCLALALATPAAVLAAEANVVITLAEPQKEGGMPIMQALNERKSTRNFKDEAISAQDLSNILWAAWGVNRNDGRRTVPTANNSKNMQVYVALESGIWEYNAGTHVLKMAVNQDARDKFGGAPLTLIYAGPANDISTDMHTGSMYQNVGLYCAAAGIGNIVKVSEANALNGILKLPKGYKVRAVQSVGFENKFF